VSFIEAYGLGFRLIFGLMVALWLVSLALRNSSIVDIFWGTGFVLANGLYFVLAPQGAAARKWLMLVLVTLWGLRLSMYILWRNWRKPEDFRYQKWRRESGSNWWWKSLLQVFMLQGLLLWIISAPLLAAQRGGSPASLTALDYLGAALWLVGFFFESAGDLQLARFKADPRNKGKLMDRGVWRYTRHPNYFGDAAQWWGFYLIAAATGGWWTIFGPILMTILLLRISGVALLEQTLETRPGYKKYAQRTSAFIPWFPRQKGKS
jgi:steroid 5-alpha reductase family enzyme